MDEPARSSSSHQGLSRLDEVLRKQSVVRVPKALASLAPMESELQRASPGCRVGLLQNPIEMRLFKVLLYKGKVLEQWTALPGAGLNVQEEPINKFMDEGGGLYRFVQESEFQFQLQTLVDPAFTFSALAADVSSQQATDPSYISCNQMVFQFMASSFGRSSSLMCLLVISLFPNVMPQPTPDTSVTLIGLMQGMRTRTSVGHRKDLVVH